MEEKKKKSMFDFITNLLTAELNIEDKVKIKINK